MNLNGNKPVNQGKYEKPILSPVPNEEVEYDRFILNLDTELIGKIEEHVHEQKMKGVRLRDEKTGRFKKINKSLWAREVFTAALEREKKS